MSEKNTKVYRYTRGEYSCCVVIVEDQHIVFDNVITPEGTPLEVVSKLMDAAEKEALKLHRSEREKWSNS